MFYLVAFLIIIVFIIETWKSMKLFDFYTEKFANTNTNTNTVINNNVEKVASIDLNSIDDIKQMTRSGYLPSNIGDGSNYQINPNKTSMQELQEKDDSGLYKYAPNNVSDMVYNEDYFNSIKDTYSKNRHNLPRDWKCQREWYDCSMDADYFNKFKSN